MPIRMSRLRKKYGARRVGRRRVGASRMALARRRGMIRGPAQPVQFFKQVQFYSAWLTSSTTVPVIQNIQFTLNALAQATTFQALYDQYQIKGVKCSLIPRGNVDGVSQPFSTPTFSIIDYDGSFPATIPEMNEYQNVKMKRGTDVHKRYLVPAILNELYSSPTSTAYGTRKNQWIDCANPAVPHYGLAFGVSPTPAQAISWDLKVTYYVAFKNVR